MLKGVYDSINNGSSLNDTSIKDNLFWKSDFCLQFIDDTKIGTVL